MTVLVYVNTSKQVVGPDHLKVFQYAQFQVAGHLRPASQMRGAAGLVNVWTKRRFARGTRGVLDEGRMGTETTING
jgi:hypothetical protein